MPSESCNSTMVKATGLMFSLFNIREVPFAMPPCIQYILHGLTRVLLCVPFIFAHHKRCRFCGRHTMASISNGNLRDLDLVLYSLPSNVEPVESFKHHLYCISFWNKKQWQLFLEALISYQLWDDIVLLW